ncbi:hypothetical protein [Shewanella sp. NIFS-20-20]|uniref:hypothetical protein n=1 Tax=Shewanella sp. NIFS-20-20 TaxID=2853806 RepID=UPI001C438087|nr:hypothetical protein [Shewanella sp. NIFS-20-20]MBV7316094.1 hypothetical protein [Shewanella sp. NIFS-20-20]
MQVEQIFHRGRYRIDIHPIEMRMSQWAYAPRIFDTHQDIFLLDLTQSRWHLVAASETAQAFHCQLTCFPDGHRQYHLMFELDEGGNIYRVSLNQLSVSLSELSETLSAIQDATALE